MVGDGINDVLVFVKVDIGIVIGSGMDVVIEFVDIVFMKSDLIDVLIVIKFSYEIIKNIK